jgi:hypothetical protein
MKFAEGVNELRFRDLLLFKWLQYGHFIKFKSRPNLWTIIPVPLSVQRQIFCVSI